MFNGRASLEIVTASGRYDISEDCEIDLWINGGSAYRFQTDTSVIEKLDSLTLL